MPSFIYHYLSSGKRCKGTIEAASSTDARNRLREKKLLVTDLKQKKGRARLTAQMRYTFTLQLAQLLHAGLPVYESLIAIEEQSPFVNLANKVQKGIPLSQALSHDFDPLYTATVAAGEATGTLGTTLDYLAKLLARQMDLRKKLTQALLYPALLSAFCLVVITLLLTCVIPSMKSLIEHPTGLTALVIFASDHWYLLPSLLAPLYFLKKPLYKLTSPVTAALARFLRTLATLQQSGLPLIDSLQLARNAITCEPLKKILSRIEKPLIAGSPLSHQLKKEPLIPPLIPRMLQIGEESGNLTRSLLQLAEIYEQKLEKNLTRLTTLAQPVILLIMGGLIGLIMLAVLLPLTDISSLS